MSKKISIVISLFLVITMFTWFVTEVWQYPQIVRSAYIMEPLLLGKAVYYQNFPGKGVSAKEVTLNSLQELGDDKINNIRLLYLDNSPRTDKVIRERYFHLLSKVVIKTNENLFWEYKSKNRHAIIEYKTGKVVFDYYNGKQFLPYSREILEEPIFKVTNKNYNKSSLDKLVFSNQPIEAEKFKEVGFMDPEDGEEVIRFYRERINDFLKKYNLKKDFFLSAEKGLQSVNVSADRNFLLPIYLEKANFNGKSVWILLYNWADKAIYKPDRQYGIQLQHRALVVLSSEELKTLYSSRCK